MYHFIGIKGSHMSSLALMMNSLGYEVEGSDIEKYRFTEDKLKENNIPLTIYDEDNIKEGMKVILSERAGKDNVEAKKAEELDLPIYSYHQMVGKLSEKFKTICVAGCHGKTTTASLMACVLKHTKGCNYLIGDGSGYASLDHEFFVLESPEYRRDFLSYKPYYAIITNIDLDHVDYFKNMDDVIDAYREYAKSARKFVLACGDDPYTHSLGVDSCIFYGIGEDNDIKAFNVEYKKSGTSFEVEVEGNYYGFFDLPIFGKHQLLDTLAAIAVCYYERLDAKEVNKVLKTFEGAKRRFKIKEIGDSIIIDDNAHHPNQVKATIHSIRQKYEGKKIVAIFEPYTYSRVENFKEDFIKVLDKVDEAYFLPIFPAKEEVGIEGISVSEIAKNGKMIQKEDIKELKKHKGSVFVFMSINDLSNSIQELEKELEGEL